MGFANNATTISTYGFTSVTSTTGVQSATGAVRQSDSESVTATNQNTGGGAAHNNVQPTWVTNKIIKL